MKPPLFLLDDLHFGASSVCLEKRVLVEMTVAVVLCVYSTPEWWPFQVFQRWVCHLTRYCFPHWPVYLCFPKQPSSKGLLVARCGIEVIFFPLLSFTWQFQQSGKYTYTRIGNLCCRNLNVNGKRLAWPFMRLIVWNLSIFFPLMASAITLGKVTVSHSLCLSRPAIDRFTKGCLFFLILWDSVCDNSLRV